MLTSPPAKIMLSSTSKVSLHDRFTKLASTSVENPRVERVGVNKVGIKPASARNRQLAIQMAKRPSVQAALRIKNKSIKQFQNANLNPRFGNRFNNQSASIGLFKRINKPRPVQARVSMGFDPSRLSVSGAPFNKPRNLAERLGVAGRMGNRIRRVGAGNGRGRFNLNRSFNKNQGGAININNSPKKGNRRFKAKRLGNNNQQNRGGFRKRGNNRNQQPRINQQPRRNQQKPQQPKTRENLDMDLDQYMAKSKSHLDADLDQYMAQSNAADTN